MGLGCVKTPRPVFRVELLPIIRHHKSRGIPRARSSLATYRIAFSTALQCMSFHTARPIRNHRRQSKAHIFAVSSPTAGAGFQGSKRDLNNNTFTAINMLQWIGRLLPFGTLYMRTIGRTKQSVRKYLVSTLT